MAIWFPPMERDVAARLKELQPDVVFNALHGTPGEDGTVQGMLDLMQIPYTHSGLETSVIAIDKELTKMVLVPGGIRMPIVTGLIIDWTGEYDNAFLLTSAVCAVSAVWWLFGVPKIQPIALNNAKG